MLGTCCMDFELPGTGSELNVRSVERRATSGSAFPYRTFAPCDKRPTYSLLRKEVIQRDQGGLSHAALDPLLYLLKSTWRGKNTRRDARRSRSSSRSWRDRQRHGAPKPGLASQALVT